MAGCPATRNMRPNAPLFALTTTTTLVLLLLLLSGQLQAAEQAGGDAAGAQTILPTRASIYQHLAAELQAASGAEQHVQGVFATLADGMRAAVRDGVLASMQALVDGVVERAEDAWVTADDAGRAPHVKQCVDHAEDDAQQVAKRALEKMEGCVQAVEDEGRRRVREATRLLNEVEDVSKRFVAALEECVKAEEAKDADAAAHTQPPSHAVNADATADVAATEQAPGHGLLAASEAPPAQEGVAAEKTAGCPKAKVSKAPEDGAVENDVTTKPKCKSCAAGSNSNKSPGGDGPTEGTGEEVSQGDSAQAEETENAGSAAQKEEKPGKEFKGKKGKDNKEKDKYVKQKKDSVNVDETVEGKESNDKSKNKNKKGKSAEVADKASKAGEHTDKKSKEAEQTENSSAEAASGEVRDKKSKGKDKKEGKGKKDKGKSKGKDKGGESGEGAKSRKKRDLLALNESPEAEAEAEAASKPQEEAAASDPWPTEGSTPEEQRVITCMRSPALKPLVDEKTRAYQRLQTVLQRTAAKQQDAPACVSDHVRKAELKISAIKQRMASCADRKMRQEL